VDETGIVLVDTALVPAKPVAPKKRQTLMLALVLGLLLGIGLAFGAEHLDDTVQSEHDLARVTGLVCLGLVPDYKAEEKELGPEPGATLITNPVFDYTFYRESYKILRTNLTFTALEGLKSLSVLSAGPGEGKTLTNANLAIALAQAGKSVLLVDADLRKPSLHTLFGLSVTPKQGLPLLIAGQANLADLVVLSPVKGLSIMPCGVIAPNPAELLGSPAMKRALDEMGKVYDMVIFDGAPVLPVTDSVVLAALLDGVILLARADVSAKDAVRRATEHLASVKAPLLGVLLNALDLRKRRYGYGAGYGYGYGYGYGHKGKNGKGEQIGLGSK
jgi:capsular exopolysaccharide synthesis family protein